MKRIFCLLLALVMLGLAGCSDKPITQKDKNAFDLFMNAVKNRQFIEAYSFLSENVTKAKTEDDGASAADHVMSLADFESYYNRILNVFRINTISYKETASEAISGTRQRVDYSVTYSCEEAGELSFDCSAELVLEDNLWRVLWSPSMIFPDLGWDEQFGRATISARRGDILTKDGTVIAETINLVTVYAVFSEIADYDAIAERIAEYESISLNEAKGKVNGYLAKTETLHRFCAEELRLLYDGLNEVLEFGEDETPEKVFKSVRVEF